MRMETLGYYNGKYDILEKMQVAMNDRGFYFGDGVYDASYMQNNLIFDMGRHIDRFFNSASLIGIRLDFTKEWLWDLMVKLAQKLETGGYLAYWQVTRGTGIRRHSFDVNMVPNLAIMFIPSELRDEGNGMKVRSFEDKRYGYCNIKSLNLIPNVLGAQYAESDECDEILFLRRNIVTECAHSNVHILRDGKVLTHPEGSDILSGIARYHMLQACSELKIPWEEKKFTLEELMDADEVLDRKSVV